MNKKNIRHCPSTPKKKFSSWKDVTWKDVTTGIMITAGVLATNLSEGQTQQNNVHNKKESSIEINNQIQTTQNTNTIHFLDNLDHDSVIHMNLDTILSIYGKEKGLEIINRHLIIEVNILREKLEAPLLLYSHEVFLSSQKQAEYLSNKGTRIHHMKGDDILPKRLKRENIVFSYCGENLAQGQTTISQVIKNWLTSPAHKYNLVHPKYKKVGVGYENKIRTYIIIG